MTDFSPNDHPPYKWKTVRVFISSTFRDFHAERDYLIKYVFPELRQWCENYKLHLVDIDLRWGVTENEAESGKVIELCLEQIDGCRPFFICMLGSRYGWIPNEIERDKVSKETLNNFPDLKVKWENLSVTHLEILHAALSPLHGEEPVPHSFFYFRNEQCLLGECELKQYSPKQRNEYLETFLEADSEKIEKLGNLKEDIEERFKKEPAERVIHYTPKFDTSLSNPEDDRLKGRFTSESLKPFGDKVKEQLRHAIENQFAGRIKYLSEKREDNNLATEREFHEAFIENRTTLYIGRTELLQRLHTYVNGDSNKIFAVYGESGSGKSALLAKFYRDYKFDANGNEINQDVLFIPHFIGASPTSTSLVSMLRRFCEELFDNLLEKQMEERLYQAYGSIENENRKKEKIRKEYVIPFDPDELILAFKDFLKKINSKVVILIDGLNQLDETDRAHELEWLPNDLSDHVKIIASTLEGKAMESLKGLSFESLDVEELAVGERSEIIRAMPSVFAKTLEKKHIDVLLKKKATTNPLYLKVALEELRIFGSFEKLEEKVSLLPDTVIDLFIEVLERLEREVGNVLVERMFCLLECSRYGLRASEIEELLSDDKKSHLLILRQLRDYYFNRDGLYDFFHRGLSKAVRQKYDLGTNSVKWHETLAKYFEDQNLYIEVGDAKSPNLRKLSVLPFQLTCGRMWQELYYTLTNTEFLEQKNTHFTVHYLLDDFRSALREMADEQGVGKQRSVIQAINEALDQASFALVDNPELTFPQLFNRLQWQFDENTLLKDKFGLEKDRFNRPWLRLMTRPAESPALLRTFTGHTSMVYACDFSPDGNLIVSGSGDKTLKLWDAETGKELATLKGHTGTVSCCAFSPNGNRIVSGSGDKTLKVWDVVTRKELVTLRGHTQEIYTCCFSNDSRRIASGSYDNLGRKDNSIKLWDAENGKELFSKTGHTQGVKACAFSPDNQRFVSGSMDGSMKIWDTETGKEILIFSDNTYKINYLVYGPNGNIILSGSGDIWSNGSALTLWDSETGKKISTLVGHSKGVQCCAFSQDGKRIISGSHDDTLKLWSVDTMEELATFKGHTSSVSACAFSPDGRRIVSGSYDNTLKLWDADAGEQHSSFVVHTTEVYSCAFSPDGKQIVFGNEDKTLRLLDVNTWKEIATFRGHNCSILSCAFSPDGQYIISGGSGSANKGNYFKLWDARTGEEIDVISGFTYGIQSCVFSPDGRYIFSGGLTLLLWDVHTGVETSYRKGHISDVEACAFGPDGRTSVSGSRDNTLIVWDTKTGEQVHTCKGHTNAVGTCIFSPDGRLIASGSFKSELFSKIDTTLRIWDVRAGEELATLRGHTNSVQDCAFSPDNRLIASVSLDETLKLWDAKSSTEIATLTGLIGQVRSCSFNPNGKHIILGDNRGQILMISLENIEISTPSVSPVRMWNLSKKKGFGHWDEHLKTTCPLCGERFPVSDRILEAIAALHKDVNLSNDHSSCLHLPDEAWEDPSLLSECPHCHKSLIFNPFIVDNKDRDPPEPIHKSVPKAEPKPKPEHRKKTTSNKDVPSLKSLKENLDKAEGKGPSISGYLDRGPSYSSRMDEAKKWLKDHNLDSLSDKKIKGKPEKPPEEPITRPEVKKKDYLAPLKQGHTFYDAGKYEDALRSYKESIQIKPDYEWAHLNLGMAYDKLGRLDDAITAYKAAIHIKPDYAGAYFFLGVAYVKKGKRKEAREAYQNALRFKENDTYAHYNLALNYKGEGSHAEAKFHFQRALQLGYEPARKQLDNLKPEKPAQKAEDHYARGEKNLQAGKIEEAIQEYKNTIQIDPDHLAGHFSLGNIYLSQNRYREAMREYEEVLRIDPDNADAYCASGIVLGATDQHEEAIAAYKIAIHLHEDHALSHFNLGLIYQKLGDKTKAKYHLKRALDLGHEEARTYLKKWWKF